MFRNILLPVDIDHLEKDDTVFELVAALADADAHVTFMHVMAPLNGLDAFGVSAFEVSETRHDIIRVMQSFAPPLPSVDYEVVEGAAGAAIVALAGQKGADLIVMRSHKPGRADILMGSVAKNVVSHAQCSVLVTR